MSVTGDTRGPGTLTKLTSDIVATVVLSRGAVICFKITLYELLHHGAIWNALRHPIHSCLQDMETNKNNKTKLITITTIIIIKIKTCLMQEPLSASRKKNTTCVKERLQISR